ncbi:hypothetical protein DFS33DRAFT_1490081 [Desarmillaria ectypa]|nr:hypothetical protein DFS33DRAFT_1490081 [Desarmillaria ectypa]
MSKFSPRSRYSAPLGRLKMLNVMRSKNNWALSKARLKRLLTEANGGATPIHQDYFEPGDIDLPTSPNATYEPEERSDLPPPVLPANPLAAQLRFHRKSTRFFVLYGRGEYDYAVTPNSTIGIILSVRVILVLNEESPSLHRAYQTFLCRLFKFLKRKRMPLSMDQQRALNETRGVQTIFEYYEASGEKAGIPVSDVGRQFEAEYGSNPLRWRTKEQNDPAWRKAYDEAKEGGYTRKI